MQRFQLGLCLILINVTGHVYGEQSLLQIHRNIRNAPGNNVAVAREANGTKKTGIESTSVTSVNKDVISNITDTVLTLSETVNFLPNHVTAGVTQNKTAVISSNNSTNKTSAIASNNGTVSSSQKSTGLPSLLNNETNVFDHVNQIMTQVEQNNDLIKQQYDRAVKVGSFVKDVLSTVQNTSKGFEKSFNNLDFNNQTVIVKNMDFIARSANKSLFEFGEDGENVLKSLNESRPDNGTGLNNQITILKAGLDTLKNTSIWIDPNFSPIKWMVRTNVPWKHVEPARSKNDTQVVQICKFDEKSAICSAEYSSWNAKLWFTFAEGSTGMKISTYERGKYPRVTFLNKVNGTECATFNNGTFHQICVKLYGYERDSGPTRVCLQIGAAIFNHGTASTDFGCFRFGKEVRHERPLEGEDPNLILLNRYILENNYNNILNITTGNIAPPLNSFLLLVLICLSSLYIST